MARRELPIGEFLERATEWIRSVEETKEPIAITRGGVPVAELRPLRADANALLGSVTFLDSDSPRPAADAEGWEVER